MLDRSTTHLLWLFSYLWPVVLAGIYLVAVALPNDQGFTQVILFVAGAYVGNMLLLLDSKWLYPKYNELRTVPERLITRSIAFVLAYSVAAIFVVTSSGSSLGIGLVLGLGYSLLAEMMAYLFTKPNVFAARYLFQLQRQLNVVEQKIYVFALLILLLGLTTLGVF